jgi:hypothetical protein
MTVPVAGGTPAPAGSATSPVGITSDGLNLYWAEFTGSGAIRKLRLSDSTVSSVATAQNGPMDVATDGVNVFWTNWTEGTVNRVSVTGGQVTTLATGQNNPEEIAIAELVNAGETAGVRIL